MPSYLPNLRIAFSVSCFSACMLLAVLWIRSYWRVDLVGDLGSKMTFAVQRGSILIHPFVQYRPDGLPMLSEGFRGNVAAGIAAIPIWLLMAAITTLAALPWIRWRFSLRTLLIAMTLLGLTLGAIVVVSR